MSSFVYANIGLIRVQERELTRSPVWDGPDYQYTTHRLSVRGVYNPEINAYNFTSGTSVYQNPGQVLGDPANAVPVSIPVNGSRRLALIAAAGNRGAVAPVGMAQMTRGAEAPLTDLAIRHQLMQPRQVLFFAVGNTSLLVSPSVNQDGSAAFTDAHNGPIPLAVDVVQISGTRTFLVDITIETYINESFLFASTASVLLSHRWTKTESIDQDMYSTIVTEGVARFRTDRLLFAGPVVPDDFRHYLFHPVPDRCQRIDWNIHSDCDVSAVEYKLVDRITYLRYVTPGVTRIEAFESASGTHVTKISRWSTAIKGAAESFVSGGSRGGNRVAGLFAGIAAALPLTKISFTVRVWGNVSITNRKVLESTAVRLIGVRLSSALTGLFGAPGGIGLFGLIPSARDLADDLAGTGIEITHDLCGTYVEVTASWAVPAPAITFNPAAGSTLTLPDLRGAFPNDDDSITGVLANDLVARQDLYDTRYQYTRPDGRLVGTRASFVRELAAAALGVPNTAPPLPPFPNGAFTPAQLTAVPIPP